MGFCVRNRDHRLRRVRRQQRGQLLRPTADSATAACSGSGGDGSTSSGGDWRLGLRRHELRQQRKAAAEVAAAGVEAAAATAATRARSATAPGGPGDGSADAAVEAPCYDTCSMDPAQSIVDCTEVCADLRGRLRARTPRILPASAPARRPSTTCQYAGCEFYATAMDQFEAGTAASWCRSANTWTSASHLTVMYTAPRCPSRTSRGSRRARGPSLTYGAYNAATGLAPGQVAILFLSGTHGSRRGVPGGRHHRGAHGGAAHRGLGPGPFVPDHRPTCPSSATRWPCTVAAAPR